MSEQQARQEPTNITARFSVNLEDPQDIIVASRLKVDGQEAQLPVFLVLGGLVVTEGLTSPAVRAHYAEVLFKASQQLALGLLKEAGAHQEGPATTPAPLPLDAE